MLAEVPGLVPPKTKAAGPEVRVLALEYIVVFSSDASDQEVPFQDSACQYGVLAPANAAIVAAVCVPDPALA